MYRYTASARRQALELLPVGLGMIAFGAFFLYFWWTIVFGIVGVIIGLIGVLALGLCLIWLIGGGRWQITVDDGGIDWQAPLISEGSFRYRLDELACVRKRIRQKTKPDGRIKTKVDYAVVATGGKAHTLTNQSGVDVETVVAALVDRGVRLDEVRVVKGASQPST